VQAPNLLKKGKREGKAEQPHPQPLHVTSWLCRCSHACLADIQLFHPHLQGWRLHVLGHLVHGISHPARTQGGMIQTMITSLETELAGVAELNAERGCMAACNVKPDSPLCPAGIAPADMINSNNDSNNLVVVIIK